MTRYRRPLVMLFALILILVSALTLQSYMQQRARAADPVVWGYSFIVYMPKLMDAPFAFRGEGHSSLRQCNRVRALAEGRAEQMAGGPGKFTGTISPCVAGGPTIIFPNE